MSLSKIFLAGVVSMTAASFVACGSDSDSTSGSKSTYDPEAPVTGELGVDVVAKTITVVEKESGERCVYEGASFNWQEKLLESDTTKYYYSFAGDSLILAETKHDSRAVALVGGEAGNLYGTWRTTDMGCTYDVDDKEYDCGIFPKPYYYQFSFSEGQVVSQLVIVDKDKEAEALEEALEKYEASHKFKEYVFSRLTTTIMKGVISGSFSGVSASDAFRQDSSGFESLIKSKNIKFEVSGNTVALVYKDKNDTEYPVTIAYGKSTEMAEDGDSYTLEVSVTYGETTEVLKSEGSVMTSSLCRDDNEDNFDIGKAIDPLTEKPYTYVSSYAKSNIKLFRSSLEDLFDAVSTKLSKGTSSTTTSPSFDDDYMDMLCEAFPEYYCKASAKEEISSEEAMMKLYKTFTK